ncbi:MAG: hypothetical protein CL681_24675 [Blastopirellula sp.]|nr:hypothetical protein [Blastopirellula sp.]
MNVFPKRLVASSLTAMLFVVAATQLLAQQKPVGIISISSVDELLGDVEHLGQLMQQPQLTNARFIAGLYTDGIDTSKPSGAVVTMKDDVPVVTAFVPIKNFDTIITRLEDQFGEGENAGNGVTKFFVQQEVYIKEQGGYAVASTDKDSLRLVPKDPGKLIKGMDKYDIAARLLVKNIPDDYKDQAIEQLELGFEMGIQDLDDDLAEQARENSIEQITDLINDTDEITFGFAIDREKKHSSLDFQLTALSGSKLAKQMDALYNAKTNFAGLLDKAAAIRFNLASQADDETSEQAVDAVKLLREQAEVGLGDLDTGDDAINDAIEEAVESILDIAEDTAKSGKSDAGGYISFADEKLAIVFGTYLSDGNKVAKTLKDLAKDLRNETAALNLKFDVEKHKGVTLHTLSIPIDDPGAPEFLGDRLKIALGTGAKSVFASIGEDCVDNLKDAIDKYSKKSTDAEPLVLEASVGKIMEFAAAVDANPILQALIDQLGELGDNDTVRIKMSPAERGMKYSIEIQDGVLEMIGSMVPQDDGF